MCGVSGVEFLVILVVAVIFLGPDRLPDAMRTLGKFAREIRKVTDEFSGVRDEFTKGLKDDLDATRKQATTANRRKHAGKSGQDVPAIDAIRARRAIEQDEARETQPADDEAVSDVTDAHDEALRARHTATPSTSKATNPEEPPAPQPGDGETPAVQPGATTRALPPVEANDDAQPTDQKEDA